MAKTIILSDLHHKVAKADAILSYESHDKVLCLGDYQDDFHDTMEDARRTAIWLKDSLTKDNHTHLLGNHDFSYANPFNHFCGCSGYTKEKEYAIWQVLKQEDFDKMKLYHSQNGIFFSHAGLTKKLINQERIPQTLNGILNHLKDQADNISECLNFKKLHWTYAAGWSRGGNRPFGGLTWCDADIDFVPTEFPQIFGHTPHPKPLFYIKRPELFTIEVLRPEQIEQNYLNGKFWGLDLDSHLNHYAIIDDENNLIIKEVTWTGLGNKSINYTFELFNQKIHV